MTVTTSLPVVVELTPGPSVMEALRAVGHWASPLLLDSALVREPVGRYSYLMADPVIHWQINQPEFGVDPFRELESELASWKTPLVPELPPFQGGIAGLLGYELGRCWERVAAAKQDEFQLPVLCAGLYDWVIAWDHTSQRCWLISHGIIEGDEEQRRQHAQQRADNVLRCLDDIHRQPKKSVELKSSDPLEFRQLTPQWRMPDFSNLWSNFSRDDYLTSVERVIEYIRAGDIFQANLTQRLLSPLTTCDPIEVFERLRTVNPAPFAGVMWQEDWAVISASPERFLCVHDGEVETRPIKGTRRRPQGAEADLYTQDELRQSEKDIAENVMIVDLLRNDLSRVCQPGTVRVPQLCGVESYRTVQHLVSEVRGKLKPDATPWNLFRSAFPGGSITGAPKVRAMQIIAELEPTVRGPYTGSLFTVGFAGNVDSNLLIRTFVWRRGWLQCGVGGGIVAQSEPVTEYEETLHKAAGMISALT